MTSISLPHADATASGDPAAALRAALHGVTRNLVDRETLVELIALAAVAGEHVLVIGPPGTAKSVAVRRMASAIGGSYFEYLLGRFSEPNEIFGPVNLSRLREGMVETDTAGMLPEAHVAYLDEVFLGSTAILNTLLGILNERVFRRGHTHKHCPLRVCVGASNALPEDPSLAAFADRFLIRVFVERVSDPQLEELLESGDILSREVFEHTSDLAPLDALAEQARILDMAPVRSRIAHGVRELRHAGVELSDRRVVKLQRLVAASAAVAGRDGPTEADLWPLVFAVPSAQEQAVTREVLQDLLMASQNDTLPAATAEASMGPRARAGRIAVEARARLSEAPDPADRDARRQWELRLEGILREIDAGFAPDTLGEDLAQVRAELAAIVDGGNAAAPGPGGGTG